MACFSEAAALHSFLPKHSNAAHSRRQNLAPFTRALVSRNAIEVLEDRTLLTAFTVVNTNDSGEGSLREAIEAANANAGADTISFDASLTGQTIVLTEELLISDDLTITGLGADQLTLDGNADSRIFNIDDGSLETTINVEISGLTLTNGSEYKGGAIYNREVLVISDSLLTANQAEYGGAIFSTAAGLTISNSTFSGNKANSGGGIFSLNSLLSVTMSTFSTNYSDLLGGGIYSESSKRFLLDASTITGSTFTENSSVGGGGIYINSGDLIVTNSDFLRNEAKYGGGIYITGNLNDSRVLIQNSTFGENNAQDTGGGLVNNGSILTIEGSTFSDNEAHEKYKPSRPEIESGGGIYNYSGSLIVTDSVFSRNRTFGKGGAIYSSSSDSLLVSNSLFFQNSANHGGGIYNKYTSIDVLESTFTENTALSSGGGIDSFIGTLTVIDSVFNQNKATTDGGGINNRGVLFVLGSTFGQNTSGISGGAISNIPLGTVTITNSTLSGNQSGRSGGGLFSSSEIPLTVINCTIILNSSTISGGGISSSTRSDLILNSIVAGNTAHHDNQLDLTVNAKEYNKLFLHNIIRYNIEGLLDPILTDNGGPTPTHALLAGSVAINRGNNEAALSAGLINDQRGVGYFRITDGRVDVGAYEYFDNILVVDSNSDLDDGDYSSGQLSLREAIKIANEIPEVDTISFSSSLTGLTIFLNNQLRITDDLTIIGLGSDQLTIDANHTGRIFDVYDGTHSANLYVSISGLTLANGDGTVLPDLENTTPSIGLGGNISYKRYNTGGAIFNYEHLSVSDLVFQDNQARLGGAISSQSGAGATMSIENSVFLRNTASAGGAIYSGSSVTVTGSSFVENQATGDGGAIYASSLTVSGSSFTENSAQGSGGAIYHPYGELQVSDSTFTGNVAAINGGGIYHSYRQGWSVQGVTIPDGPLAGQQLATFVLGYPDPTEIANCTFYENSATRGGGIYSVEMSAASHPLADVPFSPSYAVAASLPIKFENSFDPQVILNDCSFTGNTAELGGGILNRSGEMQIFDSTFRENVASSAGGGLYNVGSLVIEASSLSQNSANTGGGVDNVGNLKLIESQFDQNQATSNGGGLASNLGYIRISATNFNGNSAGEDGGGIYLVQGSTGIIVDNMGEVQSAPAPLIENSSFESNSAENGGGIYVIPRITDIGFQTLNILNSTFHTNSATESGGGIFVWRTQLNVSGSEFSDNQAVDGAGINNLAGSVFIEESTLFENIATGSGGAIATLGHLSLYNSTLSGNQAALAGGGIYHRNGAEFSPDGTEVNLSPIDPSQFPIVDPGLQLLPANPPQILDLIFVVSLNGVIDTTLPINDNDSDVPADSVPLWLLNSSLNVVNSSLVGNTAGTSGGGISTPEPGSRSTTTVKNSIVAGNAAAAGSQIAGEFTGQTNLIQDSIEGLIDPVLRDNGGPTKTHALLPGSIAINAGSNEIVENADLMTDQRGAGFERIIDGAVDIGVFELHSMTLVVDTNSDIDDGDYSSGQLSLREAIRLLNELTPDVDIITFDASLAGQTIILSSELLISDDVTIIGLGADQLTISGNHNSRIFNVDDGDAETTIEVFLSGLTLMEGYAENGGAILNHEILSITDSTISASTAMTDGGGIYHAAGLLTINGTLFVDNRALQAGGGLYNSTQDLEISGSTFLRNVADRSGGGIYTLQGVARYGIKKPEVIFEFPNGVQIISAFPELEYQYNLVTISDTRFIENSARNGGGLYSSYTRGPSSNYYSGWCGTIIYSLPLSVIEGASESVNTERSQSEFVLADSALIGNSAFSGGGVYHGSGLLTMKRNTIHENTAAYTGGGIANHGELILEASTLSENRAYLGGGMLLNDGNATISNSTFSNNSAHYSGGGIYQVEGSGIIMPPLLSNIDTWHPTGIEETDSSSLVHEPQDWISHAETIRVLNPGPVFVRFLPVGPSGMIVQPAPSKLNLINCTITGNSAEHSGGGIAVPAHSNQNATTTITNSIVAGNTAATDAQVEGSFVFNSNLIQDSIEGLLDPVLRDNGGPTKTHALLAGSVAINGGDNAAAESAGLTNDQRGDGSARIVDGSVDIGAFEVQTLIAQIDLRVVKSKTPTSGNGESASLPENITWIDEWGNYWVEIWLSTPDTTDLGILSANLNLTYNTEVTTATSIEYGAAFTENQSGTINDQTGTIENLSAETSLVDVGDDQRVLFARIKFESTADDAVDLDLSGQGLKSRSLGLSISQPEIVFVGGAPSEEVHGPVPTTQIWVNPYDLNDDDTVNIRDLLIFFTTYHSSPSESNSSYSWITDLNRNDRVDFRDFSLLIRNYGKSKANQSPVNYPQNYRDAWNQLLTVDSLSEPQHHTNIVTQSAAETVLESVVKQVSPQLTSSQSETLEQVDIEVVDLAGDTLGRAAAGTIFIDVNAAGRGWFVDASPADHSEFAYDSELTLIALPDSAAANGVDLWSVILHELGHLLGYNHETDGVMQETLAPSVRRLPGWAEETDSFFSSLSEGSELVLF
ncbi:putative outer membrane protein pmp20 precursor [Gimesia alba]|uniref:Putative outer membrane protein pmp20 n=1 Tax=Gimesia alba TaxID=2527973 RepID=A0A517RNT7_9PLAN|nr:choice-of-anchor Q domain-containing protein [Gimesia alba]QDT45553.1 putative outer membrane protein pmp20 precursor [Gimesia alba]